MNKTASSDVDQFREGGGDTNAIVKVCVCSHWMTV